MQASLMETHVQTEYEHVRAHEYTFNSLYLPYAVWDIIMIDLVARMLHVYVHALPVQCNAVPYSIMHKKGHQMREKSVPPQFLSTGQYTTHSNMRHSFTHSGGFLPCLPLVFSFHRLGSGAAATVPSTQHDAIVFALEFATLWNPT